MEGLMFGRRYDHKQRNTFAAGAAFFVIAGFCTAPALAATTSQMDCREEATKATLEVPVRLLATNLVSHDKIETTPPGNLLAPRASAAIRNAFMSSHTPPMAGTDAKPVSASEDDESTVPDSGMNTELPGVSDSDLVRFKKQMYRRDI
jgi:hypothetical protein